MSQLRRHGEPPADINPLFPRARGDGADSSSPPENWPVRITQATQHSWVITIALFAAVLAAGVVVLSAWRDEQTARAIASPPR